jgi:hypothetical protein
VLEVRLDRADRRRTQFCPLVDDLAGACRVLRDHLNLDLLLRGLATADFDLGPL